MKRTIPLLILLGAIAFPLSAAPIGTEDFAYADGAVTGQFGGTGWGFSEPAQNQTNTPFTAWATAFGTPGVVTGGALVSNEGGDLRRYGNDEAVGSVKAAGQLFYKVEMSRSSAATWGGISSMDFGTEKIKFGAIGADDLPTIEVVNTGGGQDGNTKGGPAFVDNQTYTLVCVVDYTNNLLGLFVDPDGTDYWTGGALNSADVTRAYVSGNWSSGVRLASGGAVTWDNLVAATDPITVGLQDFVDADGDGLPADFEIANGLDDNDDGSVNPDNGAAGDPDLDGLTNLEEFNGGTIVGFNGGTDPQDADTDGDGLNDGPEVLTHSTDPLDPDSDDDELSDGAEINTYLTDANNADTDSGGTNDGTEINTGTDPTAGNGGDDLASFGNLEFIGMEKFDYPDGSPAGRAGGDGFSFDNQDMPDAFFGDTGSPSDWDSLFGNPQIVCQQLCTQNSGALRQFNGLGEGNSAGSSESSGAFLANLGGATQNSRVFWVKFDMTRSSGAEWSGFSLYSYGNETAFIGVRGANGATDEIGAEGTGGGTFEDTGLFATDGSPTTIVARVDTETFEVDVFVNPNLAGADPFDPMNPTSDALATYPAADITAIRCASGGSGPTYWDNICIATTWDGLSTTPANTAGLRDSFVAGFGLVGGAAANDDSDGLTNLEEQDAGTNPTLADTDNDGANDDLEITGSANAFPNPTTDPCDPDSDDDGISDGNEITGALNFAFGNAPTDPNNKDTDGDLYSDLVEINNGYDPNDSGSNPAVDGLIIVDGSVDPLYGSAATVQTINSSFNFNQLDAAYAHVSDGKLYLMVSGNLEANFNKLELFLDTGNQVTTNVFTSAGNDGAGAMNGMTFDAGFSPEYHLIFRRGNDGADKFDLDIANLNTSAVSAFTSVFGAASVGSANTGTGPANANPIGIAYDDSNTAGITEDDNGGTAADQTAAQAVTTGLEICIDLADLGVPTGSLKVMFLLNNSQHNFASNQTLAGLPLGTPHLENVSAKDFGTYAGDQFFLVMLPVTGDPVLSISDHNTGTDQVTLTVSNVAAGSTFHLRKSTDGITFTPIPGSEFTTGASFPYGPVLGGGLDAELFQIWSGPIVP